MLATGRIGLVLVLLFIHASSSFAETEPTSVSRVSQTAETEPRLRARLALEYSNTFTGPPPLRPQFLFETSNDESGEHDGSLELENAILAGYKFNSDVTLGVVTKWSMHSTVSSGQVFELKDPYLRVSHSKLYSAGNFNVDADISLSAPVSEQSRNYGLVTSLASEQVFSFEIPASRFTVGFTTFIQGNFHREVDHQEGDLYELRFSPGVEYRLSESLLANVVYETSKTQPRFADLSARREEGSLIETGVVWDITQNIKFNPNLHTRTSRLLAAETISFGANLNWSLL